METLKHAVLAALIVMASIYAMGCTGLVMDKQTAYAAVRGGR